MDELQIVIQSIYFSFFLSNTNLEVIGINFTIQISHKAQFFTNYINL